MKWAIHEQCVSHIVHEYIFKSKRLHKINKINRSSNLPFGTFCTFETPLNKRYNLKKTPTALSLLCIAIQIYEQQEPRTPEKASRGIRMNFSRQVEG